MGELDDKLQIDLDEALAQGQQLGQRRDQALAQANQLLEELLKLDGRIRYIQNLQRELARESGEIPTIDLDELLANQKLVEETTE